MKKFLVLFSLVLFLPLFNLSFNAAETDIESLLLVDDQETIASTIENADYVEIQDSNGNLVDLKTYEAAQKSKSNAEYFITASYVTDGDAKSTSKKLTTLYYWTHGYTDYVGQTTRTGTYSKHKTSTAQPYYTWDSVTGYHVTYAEDGFRIKSSNTYRQNTSVYKAKSSIREVMGWSTKYGSKTSTSYFYAPANK